SEGHPLGEIHYREYKIILRPDRFTGPQSFSEFAKLTRHVAKELDVALFRDEIGENHLREVVFYDTASCDLYNHAFILRRRTPVRNGWPEEGSELVLKFRHVDQPPPPPVAMRAPWPAS